MSDEIYYSSFSSRDRLIHIVDGDIATCEALSVLFRLEGFQTSFSTTAEQFSIALERRRPDAFVINMHLGEDHGINLLRRIRAIRGEVPVVMMVDVPDLTGAVAAMKLGATDVISKPIDSDHLLMVLRDNLRLGLRNGHRNSDIRGLAQLTPRERQVLHLITSGQSNKEAGRELGISPRTIEVHRARVMEKLGARNTADLMRIVLVG
ncbi:MAG: LuxR C-terminal-related transcriptional regulator [Candidatus Devosia phytovorans]|uniref:LuxR C-terminal-related transcriptional regulator n=1 Tax=Candidatus Devosia phytovorans TaxID=3121372 RepID=A0AAJ5VRI6_9HYPH|nr:LuxR C-terminal-related transcriptional regulator [Devosia sp.]WEK03314.1 MAG: LuxR C-terminal-related transcriptional regulator [Devosia sp.]